MINVIVIAQVIPQWYVDLLTQAFGENVSIDFLTGSRIEGHVIQSPEYDPTSIGSRIKSWFRYYIFMRKWLRTHRNDRYDLIFAISNPPINAAIGLRAKKIFHAPFVYMDWDIYPQVIESSMRKIIAKLPCMLWNAWNIKHFVEIDRVLTIGRIMAESIQKSLNRTIQIDVIPICVDTEYIKPMTAKENPFRERYGLSDKFVVLYSGKMGRGHNIEVILKAAELLREQDDICFVFIGFGSKFKIVECYLSNTGCKNVLLLPFQPDSVFPQSIACGDIGIVTQEESMAHLFMPSKAYSMMACSEALVGICTSHDDLFQLIEGEHVGKTVTDCSPQNVADTIMELYTDRNALAIFQRNARMVAERKYSLPMIKDMYCRLFKELLQQPKMSGDQ